MASSASEVVFSVTPGSKQITKHEIFHYTSGSLNVPRPWKRGRPRGCQFNFTSVDYAIKAYRLASALNKIYADRQSATHGDATVQIFEFINITQDSNNINHKDRAVIRKQAKRYQRQLGTDIAVVQQFDVEGYCKESPDDNGSFNLRQITGVDPFSQAPVKLEPYMHDLLYHFSTTASRRLYSVETLVGCNPIIDYWLPLAFRDGALLHNIIGCADVFVSGYTTVKDASKGLRHLNKAISIVNQRFMESKDVMSPGTLSVIAGIALLEKGSGRHDHWRMHMEGLKQLVDNNGGVESLHSEPLLLNKIFRADLYGSMDAGQFPYFNRSLPPPNELKPMRSFCSIGFNELHNVVELGNTICSCLYDLETASHFWSALDNSSSSNEAHQKKPPTPADAARTRYLLTSVQYALVSACLGNHSAGGWEDEVLSLCRVTLILYSLTILNERPGSSAVSHGVVARFKHLLQRQTLATCEKTAPEGRFPLTDFYLWAVFVASVVAKGALAEISTRELRTMYHGWFLVAGFIVGAVDASTSRPDPCYVAANQQVAASKGFYYPQGDDVINAHIDAQTAYACVKSIPFHANDSISMVTIAKKYIGFQTTLAYLKNPPASYQQPAIDVMGRLDDISEKAQSGGYSSQYDFDVDLYTIFIQSHEEHLYMSAGLIGLFEWSLPDSFVSVSTDGQDIPEVYAYSDIANDIKNTSPVVQIQDQSVFEYLQSYANRTARMGLIDPHADWNQLMMNPAFQFGYSSGVSSRTSVPSFSQRTLVYNGASLNGTFANGTKFEWKYTAGSVFGLGLFHYESAEHVYNNYVRNPKLATSTTTATPAATPDTTFGGFSIGPTATFTSVPYPNYPRDPVVIQEKFGYGGTVSGYLLEDISVGVLSLPSFATDEKKANTTTFSNAVDTFIKKAKKSGMKKIIIDVSGNGGGTVFLGYDTFRRFFPTIEPSLQFRSRAFDYANTLGTIFTSWSSDDSVLSSKNKNSVIQGTGDTAYINAAFTTTPSGEEWQSWDDYFGPRTIHGDNFTNAAKWNLSSVLVRNELNDFVYGYGPVTPYDQPWAADDIILLSDGSCGSTCSIFSELMKTDAGVKSVVVGGIPEYGPMQSVAGTRGSNALEWAVLSDLIAGVVDILSKNSTIVDNVVNDLEISLQQVSELPPLFSEAPWNIHSGGCNSLDEIRAASPDVPLQFTYEAADCRLFYTTAMVKDITQLWRKAAQFMDGDSSVCIKGSTNGPGAKRNSTVFDDPGYSNEDTWKNANSTADPSNSTKVTTGVLSNGTKSDNGTESDADSKATVLSSTSYTILTLLLVLLYI
ncbi:hypothetical protein G7046_g200 [Stylonectria norvegica]|nr:hypothetical protein G7046_g200 [Stylonectria norvegica]